ADRGIHSFRRHLLRCDVRRLDYVDSAQYAGRERHHRHGARGAQDGGQRPGRRGARDRGHRLGVPRRRRAPRAPPLPARGGGLGRVVVEWALKVGPADYFSVMVFAFVTVSAVLGSSAVRGLATLFFGIWLGLIGVDLQTGQARFTFGLPELLDGINVIVVAVGLFAVGETLYVASRYRFGKDEIIPLSGSLWMTLEEWKRSWKPWLRGAAIGFPIGAMPAGGAEIPPFLSYYVEKKLSSKPQEFGKGAIEGVAGPEAANNASAAGVLVPMLTLGLPTSATAAIMLSAFQSYGIN